MEFTSEVINEEWTKITHPDGKTYGIRTMYKPPAGLTVGAAHLCGVREDQRCFIELDLTHGPFFEDQVVHSATEFSKDLLERAIGAGYSTSMVRVHGQNPDASFIIQTMDGQELKSF